MEYLFRKLASKTSAFVGSSYTFVIALLLIIGWAFSGRFFGYSNTWQLVINTGTTIVTFLIVFLIQNTQNRDARAMQIKLDELIRSAKGARNSMVNIEEMSDSDLDILQTEFRQLQEKYTMALEKRKAKKSQTTP